MANETLAEFPCVEAGAEAAVLGADLLEEV
jgi:hypothetical protein